MAEFVPAGETHCDEPGVRQERKEDEEGDFSTLFVYLDSWLELDVYPLSRW